MSDIPLESGNIEKNSLKTHFMDFDKTDVLRTPQGCQATDVSLGRFQDVLRTFLENWKNMKQPTFYYLIHNFDELKLKILPQKCVFYLYFKMTSWDVPRTSPFRRYFGTLRDVFGTFRTQSNIYNRVSLRKSLDV